MKEMGNMIWKECRSGYIRLLFFNLDPLGIHVLDNLAFLHLFCGDL